MAWIICDCNAATVCPQGSKGSMQRCLIQVKEPITIYKNLRETFTVPINRDEEKIIK